MSLGPCPGCKGALCVCGYIHRIGDLQSRLMIFTDWANALKDRCQHFDSCKVCQDAVMYGPCMEPFIKKQDELEKQALALVGYTLK